MTSDGTGTAATPRAVVAAHGELAAGLVSAVEQITGRGAVFVALSNRDLSPADLEARIVAHLDTGVRVIFTDLPAGSTTICARRLQRAYPELVVVTGASLTSLLSFALAGDVPPAEAVRLATEKARAAMQVVSGPTPTPTGG